MAMTRWERKAALPFRAAKEISIRLGKSESLVSAVVTGKARNRDIEVAIARKIGKPVDEVFEPVDAKPSDDAPDSLEAVGGAR